MLALVAGCNWAYGLDPTTRGEDRDGDGIQDSQDNCPGVPNDDQLDTNTFDEGGDACAQCPLPAGVDLDSDGYDDGCDRCIGPGPVDEDTDHDGIDDGCDPCASGTSVFPDDFNQNGIGDGCEVCFVYPPTQDSDQDGLDDACDKCLSGPPHDEDGDGIDDACDNCPLDPNPDQAKDPASLVGAACSGGIPNTDRATFDPFLVRDSFRWTGVTGMWTNGKDHVRLASLGERTQSARFLGEFRAVVTARFDGTDPQSMIAIDVRSNTGSSGCSVSRSGLVKFGALEQQLTPSDAPVRIQLLHNDLNLGLPVRCDVTWGSESAELGGDSLVGKLRITVAGLGPVEVHAVDLVTVSAF